jgi:endonuclease III
VSKLSVPRLIATLEPRLGAVRELDEPRPLEQLLLLMLARGNSLPKARRALKVLQTDYVDWNDVRVTSPREIASKISECVGPRGALERAGALIDFLSMVYHRFNRINLDFLIANGEGQPPGEDASKKRTRLFAWLSERSHAWPAMLQLHAGRKPDAIVDGGLPRVLGRLGFVEPKASSSAIRERILASVPEEVLISFQFLGYVLSEEFCFVKSPNCPHCPAKSMCPSAAGFIKAQREAEKKEAAARKAEKAKGKKK